MKHKDLLELTALELGSAIRKGEVSPREAVQACLLSIRRLQPENNAYITICEEQAEESSQKAGEALSRTGSQNGAISPLFGVPAGIKDNICTKGVKTSCASRILGDFAPVYNATVMDRLEASGGIMLGKLNMDEFAMGSTSETSFYGPVRNPWNPEYVPGGSSGGAAAAVAAGECFYALGSDTGGSIRQPASYCGVTGMKPTYGSVSRYGLIAYASSLDQIGPLARSARDCAAVLDMIQGRDEHDATTLDYPAGRLLKNLNTNLAGKTIGIPDECFAEGVDREVSSSVLETARVLEERGARVEHFSFPMIHYAVPTYYILACAEASSNLSRYDGVKYGFRAESYEDLTDMYVKTRTQGFGPEAKRRILLGTFVLSSGYYDAYYRKALQVKSVLFHAFQDAFQRYDLLLTPASPITAPKLGESLSDPLAMYQSDIDTVPVNLAGLCAICMPCGFSKSGLPIGAQLIGAAGQDQMVLNAACAYQEDTNYHRCHPACFAAGTEDAAVSKKEG